MGKEENTLSYINHNYEIDLDINLANGAYQFTPDSSTGKTFLYQQLKKYNGFGDPVLGFSYSDSKEDLSLLDKDYLIVMFDRYDLYNDGILEDKIRDLSTRAIVLIDSKRAIAVPRLSINYCTIKFSPLKIEVN